MVWVSTIDPKKVSVHFDYPYYAYIIDQLISTCIKNKVHKDFGAPLIKILISSPLKSQ